MSYSEPLINQPRVLLLSVGVGAMLCVLYIVIQSICRLSGEGRFSYYLADGLFCTAFALISFFFMVLYNNGRVRLHLILGEGAGFFAFYFSVGRYLYSLSLVPVRIIRRFVTFFAGLFHLLKQKISPKKPLKIRFFKKVKADTPELEKKKKKFNLFGKIHLKNPYKSV